MSDFTEQEVSQESLQESSHSTQTELDNPRDIKAEADLQFLSDREALTAEQIADLNLSETREALKQ